MNFNRDKENTMSSFDTNYAGTITSGAYGVLESNPINDEIKATRDAIDHKAPVYFDDAQLAKITRLRLVSDPGFPMLDVSYCYGELRDGTPVRVILPVHQFSKRNLTRDLIAMARNANVYAKGLGLLNADVVSICS